MPPPLPDRFRLEIRLGRDEDVEQWLATDLSLDRPVLVRVVGPDVSPHRHDEFLRSVRAAAAVNHTHLISIFAADETDDGAYSVSEWTGGVTLADRLAAGEPMDPVEFLPNATGLAEALAMLHEAGIVHGAIDPAAIHYALAHPAKLGGFGRRRRHATPTADVVALATTLEQAITGGAVGGPGPSQVVDGLPARVDGILARARAGESTARRLAEDLAAVPGPRPVEPVPGGRSRRVLVAAGILVFLAGALVAVGRVVAAGSGAPILFPPSPGTTAPIALPSSTTTTTSPPTPAEPEPVAALSPASFDPFGGGDENDHRLGNLVDGDPATVWRTERYRDPLPLLKPGVGITLEAARTPTEVEILGMTPGVAYVLAWSADAPPDPAGWERLAEGRTLGGVLTLQVPPRPGGRWLLWITDLPELGPDDHSAEIGEVRFRA